MIDSGCRVEALYGKSVFLKSSACRESKRKKIEFRHGTRFRFPWYGFAGNQQHWSVCRKEAAEVTLYASLRRRRARKRRRRPTSRPRQNSNLECPLDRLLGLPIGAPGERMDEPWSEGRSGQRCSVNQHEITGSGRL